MEIDDIIGPFNIYKLTFPDGKEYIGQVEGPPEKRWKNGHGYDGQPHLRQAIDAAGGFENVEKEVVLSRYSGTLIDGLEDFFIGWFDTLAPHGYNLQGGGKRGYKRSPLVCARISTGLSKPVAQIDPETGKILRVWPSVKRAAAELHISAGDISLAAHDKNRHTAGGFKWKYIEDLEAAGL